MKKSLYKQTDSQITPNAPSRLVLKYEEHLESKERSRIQPAQLFQCS
jgi:hypothetical protein